LDLSNHSGVNFKHQQFCFHQGGPFLDCAFDEFCLAAKFGFEHDELGGRNEYTNVQSHEFAESSHPFASRQQCFLPAEDAVVGCSVEPAARFISAINLRRTSA
jgi:hypothetical protein